MQADQGPGSVVALWVLLGLVALAGLRFWRRPRRPPPPDPWEGEAVAAEADVQDGPERLSCPHCLEANDPQAPFCASCGSPIGDTVTLDPLKQIRAQGWVCLAAVNRPYRLLVLVGLWLLLLPPLAVALALAGTGAAADGGGTAVLLLQLLGGGGATAVILGKATRNYIRLQRA